MKSGRLSLVLLGMLGLLLVTQFVLTVTEENANAQIFGSDRYMIVVNGTVTDFEEPIYVINTREEVICVYEYRSEPNKMKLVAVRSYKWDKLIREYDNESPSVSTVRAQVGPR